MGILTRRNIRKAKGLYPRPPCDCREVFSCGEGLPRQAVTQPTDKRHSRPSGASSVVKGENEIRACSPDRVFVMKNRTFVEFISKIRAAWLFLHIANKKLVPMRIKSRTSGLMQTPREISHTGNPTGGAEAHPAVLPAAHEATDNPDNIFYRTIRTAMKKQLIYLLASACLLAAGCSTENKTDETGYGTLAINCTADTSIDTASAEASGTPEAPAAGAFSLTVTGETGTQKWDTLTEFEQSQTVFRMGAYTVAIAHGDPDAEGAGKPYYYAEQKIEVLPRRTVNADLTATVANSQVVIRATEQFLAYFHDARFTVTTASGNEFAFTPGSDPADEPVFVKGGTRLTVTYAPQWEEKTTADWSTPATVLPYSRLKKGTGISAGNTYDYKATVGSKELSGRFTADEGAPMTDGSLESWRSAQQFPGSGTNYTFWGSGYNPFAKELCTRDEAMPGRVGTYCAKLSATYNTLAKVPAPGNLFTGDFAIQVLGGMGGNVSFGKKFAYNARPRAVRFKYHATIGEVNYNLHGGKIPVGEMDKARIFVCIVDWTAQQKVFAGTKAPTGTWDPETQTEAANGPIIGYASKFIEETTQGDEMVEVILPINYYQDTAAAPDGKYNIVVSCSTSAYGDYMDACTTNVMYVDDFEWVY